MIEKFKKHMSLIFLTCFLIFFIILIIFDKASEEDKEPIATSTSISQVQLTPEEKSPEPTIEVETNIPDDKLLTGKEYEEILVNFYNTKNFAIEKGENTFLNDFLEEGSKFKEEVLEAVKQKNMTYFTAILFKEVQSIEGNVHTVLFEVVNKNKSTEVTIKIKSNPDGFYLIIDEKQGS